MFERGMCARSLLFIGPAMMPTGLTPDDILIGPWALSVALRNVATAYEFRRPNVSGVTFV